MSDSNDSYSSSLNDGDYPEYDINYLTEKYNELNVECDKILFEINRRCNKKKKFIKHFAPKNNKSIPSKLAREPFELLKKITLY